jgi:tetratricopeptide (TPR) repeat protein
MKGDDSVVNMVTPHPYVPMLATCGIDRDAKLFAPTMDPKSVRYNQQMIDDHLEFNFGISSSERDQSHYANFLKTALPHIRRPAQDGCDVFHSLPKDIPDLTAARALEISAIVKTRGNEYFKDDNIECAVQKYNKALRYVEIASTLGEVDNRKDKIAILSNAALCLMKLRRYAAAAKHCTTVIGLDSNHVKSYFRRAHCNMQLGELSQASSDIEKAIQLSPQEDEIVKLQDIIQNLRQQQGQRDRARFSRLFRED